MSCVLRARGTDFAVDEFLSKSKLKPIVVARRGHPQYPNSQPSGQVPDNSGFHVVVSNAEFSQLQTQIQDAVRFLKKNHEELSRLIAFTGVERIALDFGIEERDVPAHTENFPPNLLSAAGNLGIWLAFTLYPSQKSGPGSPEA
jgi:hypothetical protein